MIDSHCHFDFPDFDHDRDAQFGQAAANGISGILIPGVKSTFFQRQIRVAQHFPNIYLAFGLHPYFLEAKSIAELSSLQRFVEQQLDTKTFAPVAIGEIGLDYGIEVDRQLQTQIFEWQLQLAKSLSLPVIIHHRKSHHDILAYLKKYQFPFGGVIHAFSGSQEIAKQYVDLGFYLGIGGTITYARANKTKTAIASVGLQNLLLETDAPDMPICGFQGQRNEPQRLPLIARALAELLSTSTEQVVTTTTHNFKQLFGIQN
ncbi:MAG: TatD family hydrolase [Aestuariibacter sp.]